MENDIYERDAYIKAIQAVNDVIWEWNLDAKMIIFSREINEMIDFDTDDLCNLKEFIERAAIEEDKDKALDELNDFLNNKTNIYNSVFRMEQNDGEIKWLQIKGRLSREKLFGNKVFIGVMTDVTQFISLQDRIKYMAYFDGLTELPNRVLFFQILNNLLIRSIREKKRGAVIFIDIDNFKTINDNFGHQHGDMILKMFAQLLKIIVDKSGQIARLSGDEFVIILYDYKDSKKIEMICDDIKNYLKNYFEIKDKQIYITVSIGIALFPEHSCDANELLKYADFAMYYSKLNGKSRYSFFNKEISDTFFRMRQIELELEMSIQNEELYICYQPQVDVCKNKIIGIEALIRWNNKNLGNISPAEFIPIAEKTGFIIKLGKWVIEEVLSTTSLWKKKGYEFKNISINVSPIQIKEKNFKETLFNICKKYDIPSNLLEIEITEGTLMEVYKEEYKLLEDIISNGINIAIDDFGTGYSSLNYITALPFQTIKIDKSFVDNIIDNEKNIAVIKSIIKLSESLRYNIIIEGVETREQADLLEGLGCKIIQGYYFSKPIPKSDLEILLMNQGVLGGRQIGR
jgi:diguanylate cyclase (GGDEF)-like protein/PAS domain S-box-containing protein